MPLYSVPPPFIPPFRLPLFPPPINDPFVRVFLPAVGWQASAGPSPKTSGLNSFLLQSIIWALSISYLILLFIAVLVLFAYLSSHLFILQFLSSSDIQSVRFLKFLPSLLFTTHTVRIFFHQNLSYLMPFVLLPFHIVFTPAFKRLQRHLKIVSH